MPIEIIDVEEFNQGTQIKVIGVGGGGSNAVEHMIARSVQGVEFVSANTDAQALTRSSAHRVIQLGLSGLGAGSKPDKGREAAEAAVEDIRAATQRARALNAEILVEPEAIGNGGFYSIIEDPEGAALGMYQPPVEAMVDIDEE